MIVRVWFRKDGASDGRWWTAEIDGSEVHCAAVTFDLPTRTGWEELSDRPRNEQRHFIEADAASLRWEGARLVLTGAADGSQ